MNANQSTTMYESVPVVSELNKVTGFDPLKFIRRTNKGEKKLDLKYKKLWFRLKYPNGRIKLSALKITDQLAIIEARVYFDKNDTQPKASFIAQRDAKLTPGGLYIESAQHAAIDQALSDAGFGVQFTSATPSNEDEITVEAPAVTAENVSPVTVEAVAAVENETEIVADAGYGSESNYKYIEDELPNCTALIPYSTMLKENSRKWRSDDRKVMNWEYHEADDYYIDPHGVRFNFKRYAYRNDKYKFRRDFKLYQAEKYDENHQVIPQALTPRGNIKSIMVNPQWKYFKAKARELLSNSNTYSRRKYDVESVFGNLKAYLGFKRFTVRGLKKAKRQIGIALMALNMKKMAGRPSSYSYNFKKKGRTIQNFFGNSEWFFYFKGLLSQPLR